MILTAIETAFSYNVLNSFPISKDETVTAKEAVEILVKNTEGDDKEKKFIDGDIDLKTSHKALLIRLLPTGSWNLSQWELVNALTDKLNS